MKRTKIALALSMCVLCLGMLAFAVYSAVTSARFNLNGTINFNPEGVYVDIEGKVLRGSSRTDLVELTGDNFTYKDRNYDDSTGETSGNFTMTSWSPEVAFLPSERFIQYQVTITNKSGEPITAIPSDVTAITDVTATEEVSAVLRIEPGETKTYKLTLESTGDTVITGAKVDLNFDIRTTSAYVEEQTRLKAVSFAQDAGIITAVSGDNSTSSSPSLQKALFIPKTVDSTTITAYGSGSSISLSSNIKYIIFVADITSIGNSAFNNCSGLTSVSLPSSVTSIGDYAFQYCSGLTSIEIPSSVISIGDDAFSGCSSLSSITIPSSVTSIGQYAFFDCSSLTSVTIPSSVTSIEFYAFFNCSGLTSITFGENSKLASIGQYAFMSCSSLTSVTIPSSVTSIGTSAFMGCRSLTSITFGENSKLASIEFYAFSSCTSLTSITFGENSKLASIDNYAFSSCTSLTSIEIPSSVTSIGDSAFSDCSGLKYIHLSGNLTSAYSLSGTWQYSTTELTNPDWSSTTKTMQNAGWYYQKSAWNA